VNLRTLKKLSKRAAPLLPLLGDKREQFRAEKGDNYHGSIIRDRKHFDRMRVPFAAPAARDGDIKRPARDGHGGWIRMAPPSHPLKGTIMVGAVSGYYEPEWDEETAWDSLRGIVHWHFVSIDEDGNKITPTRIIRTPRDVFCGALDIIAGVA